MGPRAEVFPAHLDLCRVEALPSRRGCPSFNSHVLLARIESKFVFLLRLSELVSYSVEPLGPEQHAVIPFLPWCCCQTYHLLYFVLYFSCFFPWCFWEFDASTFACPSEEMLPAHQIRLLFKCLTYIADKIVRLAEPPVEFWEASFEVYKESHSCWFQCSTKMHLIS